MEELNHYNCIYRIIFPNGKSYVGQATDLKQRKKTRIGEYRKWCKVGGKPNDTPKLFLAIKKYNLDIENLEYDILEENLSSHKELDELEIYWISKLNCVENGYNICKGGNGLIDAKTGRNVCYNPNKVSRYDNYALYSKLRYEKEKDKWLSQQKKYRESHKDELNAKKREYNRMNKEKVSEQRKKSYLKHQDDNIRRCKEYYAKNKHLISLKKKLYYVENENRIRRNQNNLLEGCKMMFSNVPNSDTFGRMYRRMFSDKKLYL